MNIKLYNDKYSVKLDENKQLNWEKAQETLIKLISLSKESIAYDKKPPVHKRDLIEGFQVDFHPAYYMGRTGIIHFLILNGFIDETFKTYLKEDLNSLSESKFPFYKKQSIFLGPLMNKLLLNKYFSENFELSFNAKEEMLCDFIFGAAAAINLLDSYNLEQNKLVIDEIIRSSKIINHYKMWVNEYNEKLFIGFSHGSVGVYYALIKYYQRTNNPLFENTVREFERFLTDTCTKFNDFVNWEKFLGSNNYLVQFCHGAPGVILSLEPEFLTFISDEFLEILKKAGNLIYKYGFLNKGNNLCHGISGNAIALVRLFELTKEEIWLYRAENFLANVIDRFDLDDFHPSVWTGDLGIGFLINSIENKKAILPGVNLI